MTDKILIEKTFSAAQISKMYKLESSKQTMLNAEERGIIPKAHRIQRGKTAYRAWSSEQLPEIGQAMGYLKRPIPPTVISVFSLKGGTGKSSFSFQLARTYALHNIKVLVVGLDAQESITQTLRKSQSNDSNFDLENNSHGLYHFLAQHTQLESLIHKTDLPNLQYIPETIELSILDVWLNQQKRKEYVLREKLIAPLQDKFNYDMIIFDCNPAWNSVVTSALTSSDTLISPLGADINSLKAATIFTDLLASFQEDMKHEFDTFFIVPTMVETNKLSQTILAKYRLNYDSLCTTNSIRRSIVVQESNVLGQSLLEKGYDSPVYDDFVGVMKEINFALMNNRGIAERPVQSSDENLAQI